MLVEEPTTTPAAFEGATRVTVNRVQAVQENDAFAEDLRLGLFAKQKSLLPRYVYDEMGSILEGETIYTQSSYEYDEPQIHTPARQVFPAGSASTKTTRWPCEASSHAI